LRIRTLLSISHALVVGIFIVTFLAVFFYLTRPPGPPPGRSHVNKISKLVTEGLRGSDLLLKVDENGRHVTKSIDVFDQQGHHQRLAGPAINGMQAPGFLNEVREGHVLEDRMSPRVNVVWAPLHLNGQNSHVMRWETNRGKDLFFSDVRRNIAIACCVSFLAVLAIALALTRALAAPIRKLASVVDRFGREGYGLRTDVKGAAELEDLSESFNRMAEFIETNTNELKEQKEKAERTEALRRQFLSDVSHNLRTPLSAIMGWNDALIEGVAEDEVLYRNRIRREVLHVTRTVQRLLELSRWERAEPVLKFEDIPLSELLLEVAENLQDSAEQARVTLSFEGLSPHIQIRADRQKARDVFQILLENVVEHAGTDVHVSVKVADAEGSVQVRIEDNGVGLPDTFQSETDMERGASEVGRACLGLAIASRLVKAHGGDLDLSNGPEGGAVAEFSFPKA